MRERLLSPPLSSAVKLDADLKWVKRSIWVYFWLLILEGALRKWILPGLSAPLLIIRDPVVIAIYWAAYRSGRIKRTRLLGASVVTAFFIAVLAILQIGVGTNTVPVAVYGWRSYALHLPLIAIIGQVLSPNDLRKAGFWLLLTSVPMAALMTFQYRAAPNSWLNVGAGVGSGQIDSADGHLRASGTFSFSTGAVSFTTLELSFLLYGLTSPKVYGRKLLLFAALSTLAAIPMAGSRTLLFNCAGFALLAPFAFLSNPAGMFRFIKMVTGLCIVAVVLLQTQTVHSAMDTMQRRWRGASGAEGSVAEVLQARVLNASTESFSSAGSIPLLGRGVGMGSNAAAALTTGSVGLLLGEGEWTRIMFEFGPLGGSVFLLIRVLFGIVLAANSLRAYSHSPLAWLLAIANTPLLLLGYMAQPTSLGFIVLGAGLTLAAVQSSKIPKGTARRAVVKHHRRQFLQFTMDSVRRHQRAV